MTTLGKYAFLAVFAAPLPSFAGGYGEAGVKDATVGQLPAETAAIWCPKLRTEVPIELQRQLDCEDGVPVGTARPAVAPARFGGGLFGLPPHQPIGGNSAMVDGGSPLNRLVSAPGDNTDSPENPKDPNNGNNSGAPTAKWDRLGELGVTPENLGQQSEEFREAVRDYTRNNGGAGDWSNFNP